ncbi:MAG: TonB-dependent receptor [Opitutales bacterium]
MIQIQSNQQKPGRTISFLNRRMGAALAASFILVTPVPASASQTPDDDGEVHEQPPVDLPAMVVSATRTPQLRTEAAPSVTVITSEEIRRSGRTHVEDLLREVPGVDFARRGGVGESGDFGIRGGSQGQTIVLIDGIRVKDAASARGLPELQNLMVANIERIEVLRGPQSTLYGSDAMTGVINIITKDGRGDPSVNAEFEAGSFSTTRALVGARGRQGPFSYSVTASQFETAGIARRQEDEERSGYENTSLSGRFGWHFTGPARAGLTLKHNSGEKEFGDNLREFEETFVRADGSWEKADGIWESQAGVSHTDILRKFFQPRGPGGSPADRFEGNIWKADYLGTLRPADAHTFTFGGEFEEEIAEVIDSAGNVQVDDSAHTLGGFAHHRFQATEALQLSAGARALEHQTFGSEQTYQGSFLFKVFETGARLTGNYATAFSAPSLLQLHDTRWGNPNLSPETNHGFDIGIEQDIAGGRSVIGVTYFENRFDDLIVFDFQGMTPGGDVQGEFVNVADARTFGVETFGSFQIVRNLSLRFSYTFQETEDKTTGNDLARRPNHKFDVALTFIPVEETTLRLATRYVGRRYNNQRNTDELPAYNVWDLAATHRVTENFELFGRIDNLLDQDYEEVRNFNTPGRAFYAGVRAHF